MDTDKNHGEDSIQTSNCQDGNENVDEEPEIRVSVDSGINVGVSVQNEDQEGAWLHELYASIIGGDKVAYDKVLSEVANSGKVNLDSVSFEEEYVADIHRHLTTLQLICGKGDEHMLRKLLELRIDVNNCGKYGRTPLNIVCLHGHLHLAELLISQGVDVNASNFAEDCDTPLISTVACYHPELESADTYLKIGKLLLESGACPNKGDKDGVTPMCSAVIKSDERFTSLLLRHGANINQVNTNNVSPLCKSLDAECYHNAKLLLKYGCEVHGANDDNGQLRGATPLHLAIAKNNLEMILTLLDAGADPNDYRKNVNESVYQHSSVLHLAAAEDKIVVLWLLLAKGGKINSQNDLRRDTPLLILARKGSVEGVKMLLRFGADVELESQVGTTPVWAAVRENHLQVLQILLQTCCSLEIPSMEYHMYMPLTPLEIALRLQSWKMALILLNAGASHKTSTLNESIPAPAPLRGQRIIRTRAAYRLSPEDHQALKELRIWKSQPKLLKHMCRAVLRSYFTRQLPGLLKLLNYPIRLQNYLFMKH